MSKIWEGLFNCLFKIVSFIHTYIVKHCLHLCPRSSYPGLRGPAEAGVLPCLFLCGKAETSMDNVSYEVTEVGGEWTRRVSE